MYYIGLDVGDALLRQTMKLKGDAKVRTTRNSEAG